MGPRIHEPAHDAGVHEETQIPDDRSTSLFAAGARAMARADGPDAALSGLHEAVADLAAATIGASGDGAPA